MTNIALVLSIISSLLIILYIICLIFKSVKESDHLTITISGRIVTQSFTQTGGFGGKDKRTFRNGEGEMVFGEPFDAKALEIKVANLVRNIK